ncbi:pyridoxine 5'-phosphate synthase [Vulgatibacter sp.]|uniref:pyridoxine 5'-phosphate synthase n=1 Tax=Vulgatibacter sp. TaxID=1971226 RepID=UPI0035622771
MALAPCRLGVNVDHVATIRQARRATYPDPVAAATFSELGGADQITVHLREDRRHIQDRDVRVLKETCRTLLNLEMGATEEMVGIALELKPDLVTLVPEKREELTTEGGLDVAGARAHLAKAVERLRAAGIEVSMFIDPDRAQVDATNAVGADRVEFHTGRYCDLPHPERAEAFARLQQACTHAKTAGLVVAAGHGLNYENVIPVAAIPEMEELNIGHAIVARAVLVGMERAVRDMVELIRFARR